MGLPDAMHDGRMAGIARRAVIELAAEIDDLQFGVPLLVERLGPSLDAGGFFRVARRGSLVAMQPLHRAAAKRLTRRPSAASIRTTKARKATRHSTDPGGCRCLRPSIAANCSRSSAARLPRLFVMPSTRAAQEAHLAGALGALYQRLPGRRRHRRAVAHRLPAHEQISGSPLWSRTRAAPAACSARDAVAKSPPDGYTVGLGGIASNVLAMGNYAKLPYDPVRDFTFISGMWQLPNILTARKDLFSQDIKELLAVFKKEPKKYTYASAGFGTTLHLSGEMMNWMAGVEACMCPTRARAPRSTTCWRPRRHAVRQSAGLAAVGEGRPDPADRGHCEHAIPELPTCRQCRRSAGLRDVFAGPACRPGRIRGDVIERANALTVKALANDRQEALRRAGRHVWPTSPDRVRELSRKEEKRLLPIIKAAGTKPE